jgi:hypothetical protein
VAARRFAATTSVPVERTRQEIEKALARYGADQFISGWEHGRAMLGFRVRDRMVRFEVPLPKATDYKWGYGTSDTAKQRQIDQDTRQRWRALLLVIKAKLEAVESKIATFESEFLAHIVLPNNQTVGEVVLPQISTAYQTGRMPKLLCPVPGEIVDAE